MGFADISGLTAWSSTREPCHVFVLLETIYTKSLDAVASSHKDHAVARSRFTREFMERMHQLTRQLEVVSGPDTVNMSMRYGLHSGPVTAGVLRGERLDSKCSKTP